jgi:glycolate oxidase iron-sulfur subunit
MKLALYPARLAKALRLERILPRFLREPLSLVRQKPVSADLPEFSPAKEQPARGTVGVVSGCVMSVMFGDTNISTVRLLNEAGFDVVVPRGQECCGALFAHSGRLQLARSSAVRNIRAFASRKFDAVIVNAAGCGSTLKEYGHLLEHTEDHAEGAKFSAGVLDLTEFLVEQGFAKRKFRPWPGLVTYHDACHLAHPQRVTRQPRELVRAVAGSNYVELPESDLCCGSAGTYNLTEPAMAESLQTRKIQNVLRTGALTVVTTNPGCILQIVAGLEKAAPGKIRVMHISDFLAASLLD